MAFELDLKRYGIDLLDLFRGKLSYPRAARYLVALRKSDSLVSRAIKNSALTQTDSLLIDVLDQLNQIRYFTIPSGLANVDKKVRKKYVSEAPEPITRPGEEPRPKRKSIVVSRPKEAISALNSMLARALAK